MHLFIQHIFVDIWVMYKIVLGATEAKFRESWNPATHRPQQLRGDIKMFT